MEDPAGKNSPGRSRRYINPELRRQETSPLSPQDYAAGIRAGDRGLLSRAITLIESTRPEHQELAWEILDACQQQTLPDSFRIGITGAPGVGKSTFIDAFGRLLLQEGHQPAVLSIDPSSRISKGSILGDKTRMEELSKDERVYIRPSPSGESLGGVARKTRETILLCEAAGFDTIIVETVGVGQSETAVRALVDFFLLLLQPGAGDELQGIKRGIVEMADLMAVNKSDGEGIPQARQTRQAYRNALHLQPPRPSGRPVQVVACSALKEQGLAEIWQIMSEFRTFTQSNGYWEVNRREQALHWFHQSLHDQLQQLFYHDPVVQQQLSSLERSVSAGTVSPFRAADTLIRLFIEAKA